MSTIPTQDRCLDPYSNHRFSDSFNKFTRILTGGGNYIMPYDNNTCTVSINDSTSINISAGMIIQDDIMVMLPSTTKLDMNNPDNYIGTDTTLGGTTNPKHYMILLNFHDDRSWPSSVAYMVVCKDKDYFFDNNLQNYFIYLGSVLVEDDGTLTSVRKFDYQDEEAKTNRIDKPIYRYHVDLMDCGTVT